MNGGPGQTQPDPAAVQKARRTAAADVCGYFRKMLNAYKMYEAGHAAMEGFRKGLFDSTSRYVGNFGDLQLGVTLLGFSLEREAILPAETREDSITQPLFLDGIQRLTISPAISEDELGRFMDIWKTSFEGVPDPSHTLTTKFWEADFQHIAFVSVETFSESAEAENEEKRRQDDVQVLMGQIGSDKLAGAGAAKAARRVRISRDDLRVLRADALSELTAADLERQDAARRAPVAPIAEDEAASLAGEVNADRERAVDRLLPALSVLGAAGGSPRSVDLTELARRIFIAMTEAGRIADLAVALKGTDTHVRSALESNDVLVPLIAHLDEAETAAHAAAALESVAAEAAERFLDAIPTMKTPEGRRRLAQLVQAARPDAVVLTSRIPEGDAALVREILFIAGAYPAEAANQVRRLALGHPDRTIRSLVVTQLDRQELLSLREQLYGMLADEDPAIRRTLLNFFASTRDVRAVSSMDGALRRADLPDEERKAIFVALGTLGGPAGAVLRRQLAALKGDELQRSCILALAQADGEAARPLLEQWSKKILLRRSVKEACREALQRLDGRRGQAGGVAPSRKGEGRDVVLMYGSKRLVARMVATQTLGADAFLECDDPPPEGTELRITMKLERGHSVVRGGHVVRRVLAREAETTGSAAGIAVNMEETLESSPEPLVVEEIVRRPLPRSSAAGGLPEAPPPSVPPSLPAEAPAPEGVDLEELIATGQSALELGLFAKAAEDLSLACRLRPGDGALAELATKAALKATQFRAEQSLARGDHAAAIEPLRKALETSPDELDLHLLLLKSYLGSGQPQLAAQEAREVIRLSKGTLDLDQLMRGFSPQGAGGKS